MSDRNQEPGEAAGPASGEEAAAVRDGRSGDAGRAEAESVVNQPTGVSSRLRGSRRGSSGEQRAHPCTSERSERSGEPATRPIG